MDIKEYSRELLNQQKHGEICMCVPTSEQGDMNYLLGVIVEDFTKVMPEMITIEVPEADYVIFTTPPVDTSKEASSDGEDFAATIKATWKYIFEEWFPNSGYLLEESKLDFEYYDERCHARPDTVMDIYIPICKKEK